MATNHTSVIGPNNGGDLAGAARLHREQHDEDDDGDRHHEWHPNAGVTTFRPSTADSTEIAGVMMASP